MDICGNNTRSRKAAGIEDWDWDRGAAPHCHFDRSEVEWRNLPVILWLAASGWWLGKPYNHPDGRGKGGPLWWLAPPPSHRRKRVTGFSVDCVSLQHGYHRLTGFSGHYRSPTNPVRWCDSSSLATRGSVGRQKESAFMGRLGALLRPTCTSYAGCAQWDYGYSALCCMIRMEV